MKIKIENESLFCESVSEAGVNPVEFATKLFEEFDNANINVEEESNYGWSLGATLGSIGACVEDVIKCIERAGIADVECRAFFNIMNVTLYGDYDCPRCGARLMQHCEGGSHIIAGDGYNTPYEYDYEDSYYCPHCGYIEE